jgi:hypothetical protein
MDNVNGISEVNHKLLILKGDIKVRGATGKMVNYPPYVDAHGKIEALFNKIKEAEVPPKVTVDFLSTKLGLKSSSYRAMIPLLKKLGFIDEANVPLAPYREYRDETQSRVVMARQIRHAYKDLFSANEYAYKLKKEDIISKLNTLLGTPSDDIYTPRVAGSFLALCNLADFEGKGAEPAKPQGKMGKPSAGSLENILPKLGISYTINLNLPATTDIEVFNAIFKALKENLLS